jgi:dTDP-4-dehydrorhamnose 3,5-epimerase
MQKIAFTLPKTRQWIDGVATKVLKPIVDERGFLMEMLRMDDELFKGFGQAYVTAVNEGVVKAWHYHNEQTDHFVCLVGHIKLVLHDCRENSLTYGLVNEFFIGERNPLLVQIPPKVLHGFKGISAPHALVLNLPDKPYNYDQPDEYRVDPHSLDVPYDWTRKDG